MKRREQLPTPIMDEVRSRTGIPHLRHKDILGWFVEPEGRFHPPGSGSRIVWEVKDHRDTVGNVKLYRLTRDGSYHAYTVYFRRPKKDS